MTRLELANWRGRYSNRGVMARLRRKIKARVAHGECVLIDLENTPGLHPGDLREIIRDLPENKVKVAGCPSMRPFPLPLPRMPSS